MPAIRPFETQLITALSPALSLIALTPSDSVDITSSVRMIYVGTGGNVAVMDLSGNTVVHKNVSSGSYLGPFHVARVLATGTTDADLVGYV